MKKLISFLLLISLVLCTLAGCNITAPPDGPTGECEHIDENNTGYCDKCNGLMPGGCEHVDDNNTGYCDKCNAPMPGGDSSGGGGNQTPGGNTGNEGQGGNQTPGGNTGNEGQGGNQTPGGNTGNENQGGNQTPGGNTGNEEQGGNGECLSKADHRDADKNGKCDGCAESVVVVLDIYAINDLHGKFADADTHIGVDELTTYLEGAKDTDDHVIFLSSGDMWQGSSESNMTKGFIITEWMNSLGFASMTLGNHEFDWGEGLIEENAEIADFPFLAINIYDRTTNTRVDYCDASVVVDCGELRVGIIGAIGNCYSSIAASQVKDVYFKVGGELTALIKAESERLRSEEGVDYVILSLHDGYSNSVAGTEQMFQATFNSYYGAELSSGGYVDIVFEGHTHQSYVLIDQYGVYHMQNGGENKGICHAEISINYAIDEWSINEAKFVRSSVYASLTDDEIVNELLTKYEEVIAPAYDVLGINSSYRDDAEVEDITAMLYYEFGESVWGDKYDIVLGGGFLRTRSPYDLAAGEVMYSDLQSLLPFDNNIVLCSISGAKLKSRFINGGGSDYHVYLGEWGESIKKSIDDNKTYYIVTDSYTADYASNGLTVVEDYGSGTYARDLFAEYVKSGGLE